MHFPKSAIDLEPYDFSLRLKRILPSKLFPLPMTYTAALFICFVNGWIRSGA